MWCISGVDNLQSLCHGCKTEILSCRWCWQPKFCAYSIYFLCLLQIPIDDASNLNREDPVCTPVPVFAFCRQISGAEFEQQKQASSQQAMEELLEILLTDQNISEKDRRKKLKLVKHQPHSITEHVFYLHKRLK